MRSVSKFVASLAAFGLMLGSTTAAAAPVPAAPVSPVAKPQAPDAWLMLSALGPTRSVALGGAAAAAQPADGPRGPAVAGAGAAGVTGELLPFILWFGLIAIALTISGSSGRPNTPN